MQLLLVIAVVASVAIAEAAPHAAVDHPAARALLVLLGMAATPSAALVIARQVAGRLRSEPEQRQGRLRRFASLQRGHAVGWLVVALGSLHWSGWPQLVRYNWGLARVVVLDDLLILAVVLAPMILSWAAFYEVDRALLEIAGQAPKRRAQLAHVAFHFRYHLGVLIAPVLLVAAIDDLLDLAPGEISRGATLAIWAAVISSIAIGFPLLLARVWQTEPLPEGPLRERLVERARSWRIAARDILVWRTGDRVVNAAIAGFVPGLRYVLLTDALLARFDDDQIEAILAHEAAHVRRRHLGARALALGSPLVLALAAGAAMSAPLFAGGGAAAARPPALPEEVWIPLAMLIYAAIPFARFARLLEMEADLAACDALAGSGLSAGGRSGIEPQIALAGAGGRPCPPSTERVVAVLERLAAVAGTPRDRASWLHPSIAQRVAHLQAAEEDWEYQRRFFRRLEWIRRFLLTACAGSVMYLFWAS